MFGNYRQCLNIRAPDEDEIEISDQFEEYFRGQFCVLHLKPWMPKKRPFYHLNSTIDSLLRKSYKYYEKTLYDELAEIAVAFNFVDIRMDLCVPSTCTAADIQRVAELLSKKVEMRAKVMRCDVASLNPSMLANMDQSSWLWLAAPLLLVTITLLCSVLLGCRRHQSDLNLRVGRSRSSCSKLLQCFSISHIVSDRLVCLNDLNEAELESAKPLALYGLRNVFIFWFILVQLTVELKYQYLRESLVLRNMIISQWPFQVIVNSVPLFESLIVMTAFSFSFTCLEWSLKGVISYLLDKYIRLMLPIITLIGLTIITPLIGVESPVWRNFVEQQSNVCKSTGGLNLSFLQNFISYDKMVSTWSSFAPTSVAPSNFLQSN